MRVKIWKRPRMLETGAFVYPNSSPRRFAEDKPMKAHFEVPIIWCEKNCLMRFFGFPDTVPINEYATYHLKHDHLVVRGLAQFVTAVETRFKLRVWATRAEVDYALENLGLSAEPIIVSGGTRIPRQDIYAATEDDLFAIRMCL